MKNKESISSEEIIEDKEWFDAIKSVNNSDRLNEIHNIIFADPKFNNFINKKFNDPDLIKLTLNFGIDIKVSVKKLWEDCYKVNLLKKDFLVSSTRIRKDFWGIWERIGVYDVPEIVFNNETNIIKQIYNDLTKES